MSQGETHLPPATLGGSEGVWSGSFQITASVLGLWAYEIFMWALKSGARFLQPSDSPKTSGLQSQMIWGLVFLLQDSELGGPRWGSNPLLRKPLQLGLPSCLWVAWLGMWTWTIPHLYPPARLIVVPCLCLWLHRIFSAGLQVVFTRSCSVNSCNFAVHMGGSEPRVFPFCCLHLKLANV